MMERLSSVSSQIYEAIMWDRESASGGGGVW